MGQNSTVSGGVNFSGLLLIAFIVLKLCKVIEWSWWWVVSPLWISVLLWIVFVIIYLFTSKIKTPQTTGTKIKSRWMQRVEEAQAERERLKEKK